MEPSEPENGKTGPNQEDEVFDWDVEALLGEEEKEHIAKDGVVERRHSKVLAT